jgi:predicted DNA-binding protein
MKLKLVIQTTIQVSRETRERLKKIGSKGQTYDEIINKFLEIGEKVMFFNELDRISDNEEFIPLDQL